MLLLLHHKLEAAPTFKEKKAPNYHVTLTKVKETLGKKIFFFASWLEKIKKKFNFLSAEVSQSS